MKVLNYRKPAFWISVIAIITVIIVAVCFMTNPPTRDPLEQCRQALIQLQEFESIVLYEHQYMTAGPDADYWLTYDDAVYVRNGEDLYSRYAYTDWTEEFLQVGDRQFAKDTTIAALDYAYPEWTETDISGEMYIDQWRCWLLEADWNNCEITLSEANKDEMTVDVTFTDEVYGQYDWTVTLRFDPESGALTSATRAILHSDGEYTYSTYYVMSTDGAEAANVIGSYYDMAQGTVNVEHSYTTAELEQVRTELLSAGYSNLVSAELEDGLLHVAVRFARSNPETELAILKLQLQYGTAVHVSAVPITAALSDPD